ncbi:hypothetical protein BZB76_6514 [Actinomadura pelletieri DSM 43383]|uniref:Uncharacterized protein n=1 Tax=Actinomadura pelletieri DSM 43383 TaxID=1120940 RepID=A0A495QAB6_9ACTN|nr:hypothetical protein BZB76_6514 [Actinomadura pelletieri DSM 43383]
MILQVQDGQYMVDAVADEYGDDWPEPEDSLTTGEEHWVYVITGTSWGPVTVHTQNLSQPPDEVEPGWEIVVERDILARQGVLTVENLYQSSATGGLRVRPGRARLRVHARGRAEARANKALEEPIEAHLLQIWPTDAPQTPSMLVGPDEYGRTYR